MNIKRKIWNYIKIHLNIRSRTILINGFRRRLDKLFYKKKYNTQELTCLLKSIGLKKGITVIIHSSWDEFYNYCGTPMELIQAILLEIGNEGTLLMPAYPLNEINQHQIFDIKRTPTGAGMLAEIFRRYPNVKRSINVHSVCALGKMADFLLNEHQYSITCWDEKSPYYKLSTTEAIIFNLGLGSSYLPTAYHCAESILRNEMPYFSQFFTKKVSTKFKLEDGSIVDVINLTSSDDFIRLHSSRSTNNIVNTFFENSKYKKCKISNLTVTMYDAKYLINRMIEIGRLGKTVYVKPKF